MEKWNNTIKDKKGCRSYRNESLAQTQQKRQQKKKEKWNGRNKEAVFTNSGLDTS